MGGSCANCVSLPVATVPRGFLPCSTRDFCDGSTHVIGRGGDCGTSAADMSVTSHRPPCQGLRACPSCMLQLVPRAGLHAVTLRLTAKMVAVRLTDDIDGGEGDETVSFSLDAKAHEIECKRKNAASLRKLPAPYIESGRTAGRPPSPGRGRSCGSQRSVPRIQDALLAAQRRGAGALAGLGQYADSSPSRRLASSNLDRGRPTVAVGCVLRPRWTSPAL